MVCWMICLCFLTSVPAYASHTETICWLHRYTVVYIVYNIKDRVRYWNKVSVKFVKAKKFWRHCILHNYWSVMLKLSIYYMTCVNEMPVSLTSLMHNTGCYWMESHTVLIDFFFSNFIQNRFFWGVFMKAQKHIWLHGSPSAFQCMLADLLWSVTPIDLCRACITSTSPAVKTV